MGKGIYQYMSKMVVKVNKIRCRSIVYWNQLHRQEIIRYMSCHNKKKFSFT